MGVLFPETACGILKPALDQGLLNTPWYFTDGIRDAEFIPSECGLGTALDGFKGTAPGSFKSEATDAFEAAYSDISPDGVARFAAEGYDAAMLIMMTSAYGGEIDGTSGFKIAELLKDVSDPSNPEGKCFGAECVKAANDGVILKHVGASGEIKFDENGNNTVATYDVW